MNKEKELFELTVALDKFLVTLPEDYISTIEAQKMHQQMFWWAAKALSDERLIKEKNKKIDEDAIETKEAEVVN